VGGLLGDSLFAVTHYNGYAEAVLPIATVALLLAAIARVVPRLAAACSVGVVVNVALTAPNIPPGYDGIVSAAAATLLAIMICRPASSALDGGSSAGVAVRACALQICLGITQLRLHVRELPLRFRRGRLGGGCLFVQLCRLVATPPGDLRSAVPCRLRRAQRSLGAAYGRLVPGLLAGIRGNGPRRLPAAGLPPGGDGGGHLGDILDRRSGEARGIDVGVEAAGQQRLPRLRAAHRRALEGAVQPALHLGGRLLATGFEQAGRATPRRVQRPAQPR
jgi:hypothetical protein